MHAYPADPPLSHGIQLPAAGSAILDALPLAVAAVDSGGIIRFVNRAWKNGVSPHMAPGMPYARQCEAVFRIPGSQVEDGLRQVLSGEQEVFLLECPAGGEEHCWARLSLAPYRDGSFSGAIATYVEFFRHTTEPDEDGRRQTDKMLAVGRLVGGVAHDFANLLTLISGYSEIILSRMSAGDPLRAELEEICGAANRGSRLTAQLLGFTRGHALEPKVLDLNTLAGEMERMLRPIIGEHIELVRAGDPKPGKIRADSGQMEQVIMNLVLNARDAMPRGGRITITLSNVEFDAEQAAEHGVGPGPYVLMAFGDTGEGMDPETMSHLFQPFFTTKAKGKGTGLGLSTVYGIVRENGGNVWAASQPGKGTLFTICLPRVDSAEDIVDGRPAAGRASAGNETILLVEDEESVRRLLKHVLARQGYTVLEAGDGLAALAVLDSHPGPIHLLLTDMVMPRMSGKDVAERVLKLRPEMGVIYMSGYTDDVLVRSGALRPGMSFLQKPLKPEVLGAKVREVLDGLKAVPTRHADPRQHGHPGQK